MTKSRLLIDARMVGPVGHGIGRYVELLAEGLAARADFALEPFYLISPHTPSTSSVRSQPHAECAIPFLDPREFLFLGREIARHRPALYLTPSFASLLRYPCPHVQIVHDLNHLHFGSLAQKAYYRFALLPSLRSARVVFSVSETAALEVRAWLLRHNVDRAVIVAPNAVTTPLPGDDDAVLRRFGLEWGNYFFTLANPKPHKNLALLERAYDRALAERSLPPLVISVPGQGQRGVVRTGPLDEKELGALLRHAKAFYFPSQYEGFGRPPVEAALSGTVPVVSSLRVHREVLAGVAEAVFLDPTAEAAWTESFLRMANFSGRVGEDSQAWLRERWSKARQAEIVAKNLWAT